MTTAASLQREFYNSIKDDLFGEGVVFIAEGIEYPIRASVRRKGITSMPQRFDRGTESKPMRYDVEIRISTHAEQGRPAVRIKENSVRISKDIGGKATLMRVAEIIDQDPGTWLLGLSV
jgi:hypothetical protein